MIKKMKMKKKSGNIYLYKNNLILEYSFFKLAQELLVDDSNENGKNYSQKKTMKNSILI